ncbi:MAG: hypothetical protein IH851_08315 [Armatimonadetes bacterium]|nr:hypothetical protein [Armatimonadota bacterium]
MTDDRRTDWFGVVLGAVVFLAGITLLIITFVWAANLFSTPPAEFVQKDNPDVTNIATSFGYVILRIGMLLVMSIVGSVVSGKGVRMYLAARAGVAVETERP